MRPVPSDETAQLARLRWQCRRGMRELDILLLGYLDTGLAPDDRQGRDVFERLLEYPDQILFEWLMGRMKPMDGDIAGVVDAIRCNAQA